VARLVVFPRREPARTPASPGRRRRQRCVNGDARRAAGPRLAAKTIGAGVVAWNAGKWEPAGRGSDRKKWPATPEAAGRKVLAGWDPGSLLFSHPIPQATAVGDLSGLWALLWRRWRNAGGEARRHTHPQPRRPSACGLERGLRPRAPGERAARRAGPRRLRIWPTWVAAFGRRRNLRLPPG